MEISMMARLRRPCRRGRKKASETKDGTGSESRAAVRDPRILFVGRRASVVWPKQKGAGSDESARVDKETKKAKEKPAVGGCGVRVRVRVRLGTVRPER
jgi:hypothetical protein